MGLGGPKTTWQRQTKDFGHGQNTNRDQSNKYSCLIFDNRGVGESDKPSIRYSTSEMAKDALELADHVGWTAQRQLHVIGVSMGGMIAQELVRTSSQEFLMTGLLNPKTGVYCSRKNSLAVIDLDRAKNLQYRGLA